LELEVAARNYIGKVTAGGQWKREVANVVPAFVRDAIRHYHIDKSEGVTEKLILDWVEGRKISRRREVFKSQIMRTFARWATGRQKPHKRGPRKRKGPSAMSTPHIS
jgi:hypothetical protein